MDLNKALIAYRKAVASTVFWNDHGRRGDGQAEKALAAEQAARRAVTAAARAMAKAGV